MAKLDTVPKLDQLRCAKCNLYLSVGPVRLIQESYVCGRCKDTEGYVITIYNVVAQSFLFPCRYDIHGCTEKYSYGKMEQHEIVCDKQPVFCPSFTKCNWKGIRRSIHEHYIQEHPDDIIENSKVIQIDLKDNSQRCALFICGESIYFVDLSLDVQVGLKLNIMQCGFEDGLSKYNARFLNSDGTKEFNLKSQNISFYVNKRDDDLLKAELVDIEVLNYFNCNEVRLEITFPVEEKNDPLKVLECPVCIEYMLPPIYLCDTGHSFCNSCKNKISICSFCKNRLTSKRNYALESFADIVYPTCRNSNLGCNFRGTLKEVILHEATCERHQCPVLMITNAKDFIETRLCGWYETYDEMVAHTLSTHTCNETDSFKGSCDLNSNKESYLLLYTRGYMFNLYSKTVAMRTLQFNLQFFGPKAEVHNFEFIVEFQMGRSKLVYREPCRSLEASKDPFHSCLTIPYNVLVPFIENSCIVRVKTWIVNCVDDGND